MKWRKVFTLNNLINLLIALAPTIFVAVYCKINSGIKGFDMSDMKISFSLLNAIVLYGIMIVIKGFSDRVRIASREKYIDILLEVGAYKRRPDIDLNEMPSNNNKRVNRLVQQFISNIWWYAVCLIVVYAAYLIDPEISDNVPHAWWAQLKFVKDTGNLLSAVFIFFAFQVLYGTTLNDNNEPNYFKEWTSYIITASVAIYLVAYAIYWDDINVYTEKNEIASRFSLFSGLFNGFVMILLFSRFIAMEFAVRNSKKIAPSKFHEFLILIGLPFYAVIQPLFGTFQIAVFCEKELFSDIIIGCCLVGKIFFLIVLMRFLKKKIIHVYLHMKLTQFNLIDRYENALDV